MHGQQDIKNLLGLFDLEGDVITILWNTVNCLPHDITSQPRRMETFKVLTVLGVQDMFDWVCDIV